MAPPFGAIGPIGPVPMSFVQRPATLSVMPDPIVNSPDVGLTVSLALRAAVEDTVKAPGSEIVPPGAVIGQDPQLEARRFTVSDNGIVVIAKRQVVGPLD